MGHLDGAASVAMLLALAAIALVSCGGSDTSLFSGGDAGPTGGAAGAGSDAAAGAAGGGGATGGSSGTAGAGGSSGTAGAGGTGTAGASGTGAGGSAGVSSGGTSGSTSSGGAAGVAGDAGAVDAGCASPVTYYSDADQDGYGDPGSSIVACAQPAGYVTSHDDCYDGNAEAKPGQQAWFATDRGDGSFDYDCSGAPERHWTGTGACSVGLCGALSVGWQGAVADCGATKPWITTCSGLAICAPKTEQRTQECH